MELVTTRIRLPKLYRDGGLVERNMTRAAIWFSQAAEQGNPYAMYALGKLNQEAENLPASLRWFQQAAGLGNQYAQYRLGRLLLSGSGAAKDAAGAVRWLTESAEQGNQYAQYALGKLYLLGKDAPQEDCIKLAYQSEFGPKHLAAEAAAVRKALLEELPPEETAAPPCGVEDIGNGLCRFHLAGPGVRTEAAPLLAELLCRTAQEHSGTRAGLESRLEAAAELELSGMARRLEQYRQAGYPSPHHSPGYRAAYRPRYRVLAAAYAHCFPVLLAVWRLAAAGRTALVAIDGCSGSGKTSLARLLQRLFDCSVFHMDDFYLPAERRPPDWEHIPGGHMDLERFRKEVLEPVRLGCPVCYRRFDCRTQALLPPVELPAKRLNIVEGGYAQHPALAAGYAERIFLTCSSGEQARRLRIREGENSADFRRQWVPLELRYHRSCLIRENSTLVLDTGAFPPPPP